jgi:hypothetical protein
MSISFDPPIDAPFLWAYKQRAPNVKRSPIHNQAIKSTTKESTQPQLPMELLAKIIKIAHYENDTSIAPLMRVNQACNEIAGPLLYDTIYLNKYTLSKLPACILSKPSTNPVLQESHDRKLAALARTKKLVIEEIPILFHGRHDHDLVKFCKKVVLPKVTKVVWCQNTPWMLFHDVGTIYSKRFFQPSTRPCAFKSLNLGCSKPSDLLPSPESLLGVRNHIP